MSGQSHPLVSVVMPVFNAERFLDEAVASVLGQSFADFELIAVNDGSTDRSGEMLNNWSLKDSRVKVLSRKNTGIVGALNDGLAIASGNLIARMDADDVCLPERFAKQVAYLEANPGCVAVGSTAMQIDQDGSPIRRWMVPADHAVISELHLDGRAGQIIHPSVMMRKPAVSAVGGYRLEWQWVEDYDLFLRLADFGTLANLEEDLLSYRLNLAGVTQSRRKQQEGLTTKLCNEARARKGMPEISRSSIENAAETSPIDRMVHWVEWAWGAGNYGTARKYAWKLVWVRKCEARSWRLLLKAHLGIFSVPIATLKRTLLKRNSASQLA